MPFFPSLSARKQGFTLIEIAIVLVIVGIILSIGTASWVTFMEGRRVAKTRSVLQQAKDCLVRRVVFNERYPASWDFGNCTQEAGKDGWNHGIYWLVGFKDGGNPLDESMFVVNDDARGQDATYPATNSSVETDNGEQQGVAFVLLSKGDNGEWDDGTYGGRFSGSSHSGTLPATSPEFTATSDDIFLTVKGYELTAAIKNAVGH